MKEVLIVCRTSSFNGANAKECLDIALIFGSFEQSISLLFIDDGVFQLLSTQNHELAASKDYTAVINALSFYDVDKVFYCSESLEQRGLHLDKVKQSVQAMTNSEIVKLINNANQVFNF